ncbi:hypothetical protein LIER_34557 [Lithospermum erythrorhizon]|uniref:Aminotransferase-like plant mobile domain-containing protein n=1 Tax=Lithospermum erythrorhizon TaxID=34254 RepID=A0AAV3S0M7_LITER
MSVQLLTLPTFLGSLFVDKTHSNVSHACFPLFNNMTIVPSYARGAATLANLYHQIGMTSRVGVKQIAGCLTLLEIYEYFPSFQRGVKAGWMSGTPRAVRWSNIVST